MVLKKFVGFLPGTEWPHWMHWTFDVQLGIDFDGVKTRAPMLSCGLLLTCSRVHKEVLLESERCNVFFFFFRDL